jgi:hypothetical protein
MNEPVVTEEEIEVIPSPPRKALPNYYEKLEELVAEGLNPKIPEVANPKVMFLQDIKTARAVFQPRSLDYEQLSDDSDLEEEEADVQDQTTSGKHIRNLARAIAINADHRLAPIKIWWSGNRWLVVDGHHSLDAYRLNGRHHKHYKTKRVPVSVFNGTLKEAIIKSTSSNSRDKLVMSGDDKSERAWVMVVTGGFSKPDIVRACGVSGTTVANMLRGFNHRKEKFPKTYSQHAQSMTWREMLKLMKHNIEPETKTDEAAYKEKFLLNFQRGMTATFGNGYLALQNPEWLIEGLMRYSTRYSEILQEEFTKDSSSFRGEMDDDEEVDF